MRRPGIFAALGTPSNADFMLSWLPGAVSCYYDHLRPNKLFEYKARNPSAQIIVRFQHPLHWSSDPERTAVEYGQQVASRWPEIRSLDPYICFANELNLYYENGDQDPNNQPQYESQPFYQAVGRWVGRTAQVIKSQAPEMKLITPPFSPGRNEDGNPNERGHITAPFAGYDYLADAVRTYFDNTLAVHAYWGDVNGSRHDWLYDPQISSRYAFRWRRLLTLFQTRYNISARVVIDEAGNFATYDGDFFEQVKYFSQETLADPRVLALTFYLWEDPAFSPGNIFNIWTQYILDLPAFINRLGALPEVAPATQPLSAAPATSDSGQFDGTTVRVLFDDGRVEAMPLESYLRAVVPAEMPALWPAEALKAQAVASRTYALATLRSGRFNSQGADISASFAQSQQFNTERIHPEADAAVLATKSLVLTYEGRIAQAYFSANCGGHTLNNEAVPGIGGAPQPYLRGVTCPAPGPKNGHGVGMCQHGARALAEQGWTFDQILAHYYRNATLSRLPLGQPPAQQVAGKRVRLVSQAMSRSEADNLLVRLRDSTGRQDLFTLVEEG